MNIHYPAPYANSHQEKVGKKFMNEKTHNYDRFIKALALEDYARKS